jgi:hypothetical protein
MSVAGFDAIHSPRELLLPRSARAFLQVVRAATIGVGVVAAGYLAANAVVPISTTVLLAGIVALMLWVAVAWGAFLIR